MYNNSFWDTVQGQESINIFKSVMIELSNRLGKEKKQEVFTVFKSDIYSFLKSKIKEGYTYVDSISSDGNCIVIILSHEK